MGVLCAIVGGMAGLWIWLNAEGDGYASFAVAAPLAGFVSGSVVWWLMRERRGRIGMLGGAMAGGIAAIVGHWLCWYGILVGGYLCNLVSGACIGSLGETPMNPPEAFAGASIYTLASLILLGWITLPAGAIIGAVLGRPGAEPGD